MSISYTTSGITARDRAIFQRIDTGQLQAHTSVFTPTEVLTHPKRTSNARLVQKDIEALGDNQNLSLLDVNAASADSAADLRARYKVRTPDAIQIDTALEAGCEAFLTNDRALRRVKALRVLVLDKLAWVRPGAASETQPLELSMQAHR